MGQPPNPLTSVHYGRYSLTQSGSILLACSGSILRACFHSTVLAINSAAIGEEDAPDVDDLLGNVDDKLIGIWE